MTFIACPPRVLCALAGATLLATTAASFWAGAAFEARRPAAAQAISNFTADIGRRF